MKVYIVTKAEYEDKEIVSAFSDLKTAQIYQARNKFINPIEIVDVDSEDVAIDVDEKITFQYIVAFDRNSPHLISPIYPVLYKDAINRVVERTDDYYVVYFTMPELISHESDNDGAHEFICDKYEFETIKTIARDKLNKYKQDKQGGKI